MKLFINTCIAIFLLTPGINHAAEIYNKDGNKLDLYGKIQGEHYLSDDDMLDGDQSYMRFGFKGQTQINEMVSGFGQWESDRRQQ